MMAALGTGVMMGAVGLVVYQRLCQNVGLKVTGSDFSQEIATLTTHIQRLRQDIDSLKGVVAVPHDLGLLDSLVLSAENLSEQDIETKFSSLSLAFKTDRMTLQERLELQHRQRDIAGNNWGAVMGADTDYSLLQRGTLRTRSDS